MLIISPKSFLHGYVFWALNLSGFIKLFQEGTKLECELYRETVVTSPGPSTKETIAINASLELVYIHDYEILTCWISDNPRDVLSRLLIHVLVIVFIFLVYNCLLPNCSWGGPLSQNWLDQQLCLQKQILSRMLELGMTPGKLKIPNRNSYWLQFSCNVMHKQGIQDDSLGIYLTQKHEIKSYLKRWNFISHAPSQSNNVADQMYSHFVPVLPSFSGNVPAALKKIFPSANITRLGDWYFSFLNAILLVWKSYMICHYNQVGH